MNSMVPVYLLLSLWPSMALAELHNRGGGLVYDDVLNVTWLQDANYAMTLGFDPDGGLSWQEAMDWAASLSYHDGVRGVTYTDWRLPKVDPVNGVFYNSLVMYDGSSDAGWNITSPVSEMSYMYYVNLGNPPLYTPQGSAGCYVGGETTCLENTGPFLNLLPRYYWAETEYVHDTNQAYAFIMTYGMQGAGLKGNQHFAWAVRDGDVAPIPEPASYALMLSGLALIGFLSRSKRNGAKGG